MYLTFSEIIFKPDGFEIKGRKHLFKDLSLIIEPKIHDELSQNILIGTGEGDCIIGPFYNDYIKDIQIFLYMKMAEFWQERYLALVPPVPTATFFNASPK